MSTCTYKFNLPPSRARRRRRPGVDLVEYFSLSPLSDAVDGNESFQSTFQGWVWLQIFFATTDVQNVLALLPTRKLTTLKH